jgi:hypothetical protein
MFGEVVKKENSPEQVAGGFLITALREQGLEISGPGGITPEEAGRILFRVMGEAKAQLGTDSLTVDPGKIAQSIRRRI